MLLLLVFAVLRPRGWSELVGAVPALVLVVGTGSIALSSALAEVERLAPVTGFLAAILVLARLCDDEGLFKVAGARIARLSGGGPRLLLVLVFGLAAVTTAVLSLDATVVLLTPVILATATQLGLPARPHLYACAHLANSASLLLPVANLTNLLVLATVDISFVRFAAMMALPWLAVIAVEYAAFRLFFAADLSPSNAPPANAPPANEASKAPATPAIPRFAVGVLTVTLFGFAVSSLAGIEPVWVALAAAAVLGCRALVRKTTTPLAMVKAANPAFLAFVLILGIVVRAVVENGLATAFAPLIPRGDGLASLLLIAALGALLANLINNLPATLLILPFIAGSDITVVFAALIGLNIGPNLTYVGSLATLLWRRVIHEHHMRFRPTEFIRLGLATVPACLVVAVVTLWAQARLLGMAG